MASSRFSCIAVPVLIASALASPVAAQVAPPSGFEQLPRIGVGYVANAPNMYVGGSAYFLTDVMGGLGLYADFKKSQSSPADGADFIESMTPDEAELLIDHEFSFDEDVWWSVNAALIRPISPELMLYLGAGFTDEKKYLRYTTTDQDFGLMGRYWIADEEASGTRVNVLAGAFLRITQHLAVQFGGELAPRGLTVGGSFSLPLR